jgi:hypothetical protein
VVAGVLVGSILTCTLPDGHEGWHRDEGGATFTDHDHVHDHVATVADPVADLEGERDRARDLAALLEERIARALALHFVTPDGEPWCAADGSDWPCPTVLALNPEMEDDE